MAAQIMLGIALGLAGAVPFGVVLNRSASRGRRGPGIRSGFSCIFISFSTVLIGAKLLTRSSVGDLVTVAVTAALTMLVSVTVVALLTWRRLP